MHRPGIDTLRHRRLVIAFFVFATCPLVVFAQETGGDPQTDKGTVARLALVLMVFLLSVLILAVGWFLMRALQRSRERLYHTRSEPTDATDVWSMHKLPEFDSEDTDPSDDSNAEEV